MYTEYSKNFDRASDDEKGVPVCKHDDVGSRRRRSQTVIDRLVRGGSERPRNAWSMV